MCRFLLASFSRDVSIEKPTWHGIGIKAPSKHWKKTYETNALVAPPLQSTQGFVMQSRISTTTSNAPWAPKVLILEIAVKGAACCVHLLILSKRYHHITKGGRAFIPHWWWPHCLACFALSLFGSWLWSFWSCTVGTMFSSINRSTTSISRISRISRRVWSGGWIVFQVNHFFALCLGFLRWVQPSIVFCKNHPFGFNMFIGVTLKKLGIESCLHSLMVVQKHACKYWLQDWRCQVLLLMHVYVFFLPCCGSAF